MSFDVKKTLGGHDLGGEDISLGAVDVNNLISYARVIDYTENTVTISKVSAYEGLYHSLTDGNKNFRAIIHVSTSNNGKTDYLGRFLVVDVYRIEGNVLQVSGDFTQVFPKSELSTVNIQIATILDVDSIYLDGSTISPQTYSVEKGYGGILFISAKKSIDGVNFCISAKDCGIPVTASNIATLRPEFMVETYAYQDTQAFAGWQNTCLSAASGVAGSHPIIPLNAGDGLIILSSKYINLTNGTVGRKLAEAPSNWGTWGCYPTRNGARILIAADSLRGFENGDNLNKSIVTAIPSPQTFGGVGGCYVVAKSFNAQEATDNIVRSANYPQRNDEGCYAYDIRKFDTSIRELGIKNYLNGDLGEGRDITTEFNNYARVLSISDDGYKITYDNKTEDGLAKFKVGAYVLFLVSQWKEDLDMEVTAASYEVHPEYDLIGKFKVCKILADDGATITLDSKPPELKKIKQWFNNLSIQLVTIACFTNLIQSVEYYATREFNETLGTGGLLAIACSGELDLTNGTLLTGSEVNLKKGTRYGAKGLRYIGNAQDNKKLPIGQGLSSAFILTKKLILSSASKIGAKFSNGAFLGGFSTYLASGNRYIAQKGGGYAGLGSGRGFGGGADASFTEMGGFGGSGLSNDAYAPLAQGAHIMCISDMINNFSISAFCTGGGPARNFISTSVVNDRLFLLHTSGGAGYGCGAAGSSNSTGSAGYNAGGGVGTDGNNHSGGSSGWCFIYCNKTTNESDVGLTASQASLDKYNRTNAEQDVFGGEGNPTPEPEEPPQQIDYSTDQGIYTANGLTEEQWDALTDEERENYRGAAYAEFFAIQLYWWKEYAKESAKNAAKKYINGGGKVDGNVGNNTYGDIQYALINKKEYTWK